MPSCVSTNVSGRKYEAVWVELREKKWESAKPKITWDKKRNRPEFY